MTTRRRPIALIILDGFGLNPNPTANAVHLASTPNFDYYWGHYPHTTLEASGAAVGLLPGQMGDSNVGHLNLGAGRVVYQTLTRIEQAVRSGRFMDLPIWQTVSDQVHQSGGAIHLMGLLSDGGVHSHISHLMALIDVFRAGAGLGPRLYVHAFLDGRDVAPANAPVYLEQLEEKLRAAGNGYIASISGRYYAMDRDRRWERTQLAFQAITGGAALRYSTVAEALAAARARGENDEFVSPTVLVGAGGAPVGLIRPGDAAVFFNFRADRARQLTRALAQKDFSEFRRPADFVPVPVVTMAQYDQQFPLPAAFLPEPIRQPLGEVVSAAGLKQLRIAETEKYAHVTYFFNGGNEDALPGERRLLIPSPKVATYDLQPEMSAPQIAEAAVRCLREDPPDFIVLNFANADMVGHTGNLAAAIAACAAVDTGLGEVTEAVRAAGGAALVLADHGNADQMIDYATGRPHTNHTLYPVPCILIDDLGRRRRLRDGGVLGNAAPTILELMGLPKPEAMTLDSLLE